MRFTRQLMRWSESTEIGTHSENSLKSLGRPEQQGGGEQEEQWVGYRQQSAAAGGVGLRDRTLEGSKHICIAELGISSNGDAFSLHRIPAGDTELACKLEGNRG
jgi:hypothetical protein